MRKLFLALLFIALAANLRSQTADCIRDFDYLVKKIKADYPGYVDKVTPKTRQDLALLEKELRGKIQQYPDSCGRYLSTYASWFKDHHLRIRRLYSGSVSNSNVRPDIKIYPGKIDSLTLSRSGSSAIEGLWHSFGGDIAIIKSSTGEEFLGISLSYRNYSKNQVVFTLNKLDENEFTLISYPYYNNFKPQKGKASLRLGGKVIELHDDTRFVRKSPSPVADNALLYSYFPEFPNGANIFPLATRLSDSTFYLRITSFEDNETELAVKKHWSEITTMPNLIIDIRGNGGGQDDFYQILADLIYTNPYESKTIEWYATENNIKRYEDDIKNGGLKDGVEALRWTKALLAEMKKNVGGFVIHPLMGKDETVRRDTKYHYPQRVGIIIDEGVASSAEQFLLDAKESSKVLLFGNCNSAGVLDYSNAITEKLPSGRYELTFPMSRSRRLPGHPIDNIGIPPDVYIPYPWNHQLFDRLDQWVYFVKDYLELLPGKK